jgi:hypothetical protein
MNIDQRHEIAEKILSYDTFVIETTESDIYNYEINNKFYRVVSINDVINKKKEDFYEISDSLELTFVDAEIIEMRRESIIEILKKI